ncbi:MAG TPA: HAMP domain-containing sensor histidine kinase [Acidimicrobiia bacterium]|nr:HAMP domain-containing sensor histidine kinase [Acidimicrobiia bacterium]
MTSLSKPRLGPTAFVVGVAIGVTGVLFTLGVAAADARAASERFDSMAASTAFAIESELNSVIDLLHGARAIREFHPALTNADFAHYLREARPVAGVIAWGTLHIDDDAYVVDLFYSESADIDWRGIDLSARRETREPIARALRTHNVTSTAFAAMPDLPHRSALLINPHEHDGNPSFAIVSADLLAAGLPSELASHVSARLSQSTQLMSRDVAYRGMTVGFGNHLWSLMVVAESADLYPNEFIVPLGVLITVAVVLSGMVVSSGISQRRRLDAEVADSDRINAAREEFIASVSHEIRTPLTAVVGYAEVLEAAWDDLSDDEALDMVRQISEQSMEVSALVKDLLVGSRADISSLHLDIDTVRVREVTERALASIPSDMRRSIEIGFDDDRAWTADAGRCAQIVRNLVVNALKYGGHSVSIESRRLPDSVVLSVVDDGAGVDAADIERIFQPFASIARSSQALPSVGLGLYVSSSLARAMGGSLTYRRHNDLTAFDLELPEARIESRLPVS